MTITQTPRLGLNKWGATSDSWTYLQQNADADAAEAVTAMYAQGTLAGRPAASKIGRFYWATDQAAGAKLSYDNGSVWELVPVAAGGSVSTQAIGDAGTAGTSTAWSKSDHKHVMPAWATSAVALDGSGSAGAAATVPRGDHKHALPGTLVYNDGSTVNFSGEVQIGGQAVSRGVVGVDLTTTPGATAGVTELMYTQLQSTFTAVTGHAYLIVFTYHHTLVSGGGVSVIIRLRNGTTTAAAEIDNWSEVASAILGIGNSRSIYWAPAAGSHTISPSIVRISGTDNVHFDSGQLVIIDIGT